ncbi:MAG: imidazole glycerol phosphate synthase subunit HisH [Alphaproteobacteria bacterium]|nr:imidazole glycerol phosphate synthase subunit HisH [Alphaproteobacteria bacterium]
MRISIVDCGVGNLESVRNSFLRLGAETEVVDTPEAVLRASRLVLPGVGAAGYVLDALRHRGLDAALSEAVLQNATPLLGICVGMQIMASTLHEFGRHQGLGWIKGEVVPLTSVREGPPIRVPHMGWSPITVEPVGQNFFVDIRGEKQFYFCHSFGLLDASAEIVSASCAYGQPFVAALQWQTVFATQFHPEKSQSNGEKLLSAFMDWAP